MELLRMYNDILWKYIYRVFSIFTDNIPLILFILAFCIAPIIVFIRTHIIKKQYLCGIIEPILCCSVNYAMIRTPMIHPRMNLALSVTSDIIYVSDTYKNTFANIFDINEVTGTKDIAMRLYHATVGKRDILVNSNPTELYRHFFSTFDSIMSCPFVENITSNSISIINGVLTLLLILILSISLNKNSLKISKALYTSIVFLIFTIILAFYFNLGSFIFIISLFICEIYGYSVEKQSIFRKIFHIKKGGS